MKRIFTYLLLFLVILITAWISNYRNLTPNWVQDIGILFDCIIVGGIGGILYCLRATYLNACVRKNWDREWHPWYYIRPLVSLITGGVSWLFLKAGLLVLDAAQASKPSNLGFLALAFVAGYNVDKFLGKVEQISEATWGINKSRSTNIKSTTGEEENK